MGGWGCSALAGGAAAAAAGCPSSSTGGRGAGGRDDARRGGDVPLAPLTSPFSSSDGKEWTSVGSAAVAWPRCGAAAPSATVAERSKMLRGRGGSTAGASSAATTCRARASPGAAAVSAAVSPPLIGRLDPVAAFRCLVAFPVTSSPDRAQLTFGKKKLGC